MQPATWHFRRPAKQVDFNVALEAWTEACLPILEKVASRYGATITTHDLQAELFSASGYHTRRDGGTWLPGVVDAVLQRTIDEGLPPLASLVVGKGDGIVGPNYRSATLEKGSLTDTHEIELLAAADRLACYKKYCDDVPADAKPELTRTYVMRKKGRMEPSNRAPDSNFCPRCNLMLLPTGQCDNCD